MLCWRGPSLSLSSPIPVISVVMKILTPDDCRPWRCRLARRLTPSSAAAPPSTDGVGRSVVTIVGSRGNFCSGSLIAPALVLTVGHCVQPGADLQDRRIWRRQAAAIAGRQNGRRSSRLQYAGDAGASRHRRRRVAAARSARRQGKIASLSACRSPDCRRQPLHHRRHRRHRPRRRQERRHYSQRRAGCNRQAGDLADQAGRSADAREHGRAWRLHRGFRRSGVRGPARAGPPSSASSVGRPGRTDRAAAAA